MQIMQNHPIPTTLLKKVLPGMIGPITSILNISITTGIFAQTWKTAIICPLVKKAELALQLSNFRPVSNLSFLSRVVECAYFSNSISTTRTKISFQIIKVLIMLTIGVGLLW